MTDEDFRDNLKGQDPEKIQKNWESRTTGNPDLFSDPKARGNMVTASPSGVIFQFTDYAAYSAVVHTAAMSANAYRDMRIASIGAVVQLSTGKYVATKREGATHANNMGSASCAGVADIKEGKPDFEAALYKRLEEVLGIKRERVEEVGIVSVHSAGRPDFSGMIGYHVKVDAKAADLKRNGAKKLLRPDEISEFVIEHFGVNKDMNADGAMCLMNALGTEEFEETVLSLKARSNTKRDIVHGRLYDGDFS
jgi:hypothetical protein